MNVKILTLVIVLLVSLLCSARAGPMASTEPTGRLEEETPSTPPVSQGANAVLEQAMAESALPQVSDFRALPLPRGTFPHGAQQGLKRDDLRHASWFF
ncbi:hypothetical protein MATL_G00047210 [Megalops atlanticus]|uniref:Uncharacterized protein n=1 Tax=Megalops atlanticus TaxID=7932 RepID=A0A9D3TAM5_MEGAT|nr:hypothetical protein MATL_G00047210 [Megalops atlanticus]